ncbi:hypothetical protein [Vibrio campbellii]|uniref:hypothetical protein n=1 Tax=Vibrio campbellii TaxID=680 RepID=UPI003F87695F
MKQTTRAALMALKDDLENAIKTVDVALSYDLESISEQDSKAKIEVINQFRAAFNKSQSLFRQGF